MRREGASASDLLTLMKQTMLPAAPVNRLFVEGDHWQNGAGWVGPMPASDDEDYQLAFTEIKKAFVSANRIEETCSRKASGMIGREPAFQMVPRRPMKEGEELSEQEQARIDAQEAAFTQWWNEHDVHAKLYRATMNMTWGRRSVLRLLVPSGFWARPVTTQRELYDFMRWVHLDVMGPEYGHVHTDPATTEPLGIVTYTNEDKKQVIEVAYTNGESSFVDVLVDEQVSTSKPLRLGGRITMFEMMHDVLVSEPMRVQQRAHNLALSMLPRNVVTSGFLERVIRNAAQPGYWTYKEDGVTRDKWIPRPVKWGAGSVVWLEGIEGSDPISGKSTFTNPDITYRPPSDVSPVVEAAAATYQTILEEARQAHVLMDGDANASGRSRVEARKDYERSLKLGKPVVERAGRWLFETVVALAEALQNGGDGTSTVKDFRADFACRLDTGALTPEERQQNILSMQAGTLPHEAAIAGEGIDDVDAALVKINTQTGVVLNELKTRAEIIVQLVTAGTTIEAAAKIAGLDEEDVKALQEGANDILEEEQAQADADRKAAQQQQQQQRAGAAAA